MVGHAQGAIMTAGTAQGIVVQVRDLPLLSPVGRGPIPGERLLEGRAFGISHITLVLGETPPGQGTRLHRHNVEEVIVVHAGRGTFTVGDTTSEVGPGEVVIIPPGVSHRFVNRTQDTLYHTDVFATDHFAVEVIED
jgi:quercetin dioxygenase-like cupin family protein